MSKFSFQTLINSFLPKTTKITTIDHKVVHDFPDNRRYLKDKAFEIPGDVHAATYWRPTSIPESLGKMHVWSTNRHGQKVSNCTKKQQSL
jgi:hypothetical protein